MNLLSLFDHWWYRLLIASIIWAFFWPALWYFRLGDITGPKAWFWIVGELNYPFAVIFFYLADGFFGFLKLTAWKLFLSSLIFVAVVMPFFYHLAGFRFGVLVEAVLFS